MITIGWHDDIEQRGEWETEDARGGAWSFTLDDGTVLAEGEFRNGVEVAAWPYATKRGTTTVDFGEGLDTAEALPAAVVGFDMSTYRDVHYDEPWGRLTPFAFIDALLDWRAFVIALPAEAPVSRYVWADGLTTRDDLAIYVARYPALAEVVGDHDDAFRQDTLASPPLSEDRQEWWWQRIPHSWNALEHVPPAEVGQRDE